MARLKPIAIDLKYGLLIGLGSIATTIIGSISKWKEFYALFVPNGEFTNWRFFGLILALTIFTTLFVMNIVWRKEYDSHEMTKNERDNLKDLLKISENERLTDVITGIPNSRSLQKDIDERYAYRREGRKMQFILIDLKDFRKINNRYGFNKTNDLLRSIAQTIYKRMRRNEDMYKYSVNEKHAEPESHSFYRVYPGGDEFAFIIEGDQADAIGFVNRLVVQFGDLSDSTLKTLGEKRKLSFHCAIVEMDPRDSFPDIFQKAEDCYTLSKSGDADFTLSWHPISQETLLSRDPRKKADYERCRTLFQVKTMTQSEEI